MKKTSLNIVLYTLAFLFLFLSCIENRNKKHNLKNIITLKEPSSQLLFEQKCMICHETKGKTARTMLAPPFYEVKRRYMMVSMNKEDFIETMSIWIKNPTIDNSFMDEAIKKIGIMPKLNYSDYDITRIVNYIYNTDFPEPIWLKGHTKKHEDNVKHLH